MTTGDIEYFTENLKKEGRGEIKIRDLVKTVNHYIKETDSVKKL